MGKKHDEAKDLRLLSRKCQINYYDKTIRASKNTIIGNNSWGRIDFLVNYCGWRFIFDNEATVPVTYIDRDGNPINKKKQKKEDKAPKLTNKKRKNGQKVNS